MDKKVYYFRLISFLQSGLVEYVPNSRVIRMKFRTFINMFEEWSGTLFPFGSYDSIFIIGVIKYYRLSPCLQILQNLGINYDKPLPLGKTDLEKFNKGHSFEKSHNVFDMYIYGVREDNKTAEELLQDLLNKTRKGFLFEPTTRVSDVAKNNPHPTPPETSKTTNMPKRVKHTKTHQTHEKRKESESKDSEVYLRNVKKVKKMEDKTPPTPSNQDNASLSSESTEVDVTDDESPDVRPISLRKYIPFEDARNWIRRIGLKTETEWQEFARSKYLPKDIPIHPENVYSNSWKGFKDWLGY